MKRSIFTLLVVSSMMISGAFAQGTDSGTATVVTEVLANLSISAATTVNFGNVASTSDPVIDPTGASHSDVASPVIGTFTVAGAAGASVDVSFDATATLSDGAATPNTITFTPDLAAHATTQAGAPSLATGADITLNGSGAYLFWVGGELGTPGTGISSQTAGSYSTANTGGSAWNVTVTYN